MNSASPSGLAKATGPGGELASAGFHYWRTAWGPLAEADDPVGPSIMYGFETLSTQNAGRAGMQALIPRGGAVFGFVAMGQAGIAAPEGDGPERQVAAGMFFSAPDGADLTLAEDSVVFAAQPRGYLGMALLGGPIEVRGRLKYIDSCSDTLLIGPPVLGDPCLNHLHFPPGIDQTAHNHPSCRAGVVARGHGRCWTPEGMQDLEAGGLFFIAREADHRFITDEGERMDVIAYHPDSDHGPTHEEHPMINRTWVGGKKIDNREARHLSAEVVVGRGGAV